MDAVKKLFFDTMFDQANLLSLLVNMHIALYRSAPFNLDRLDAGIGRIVDALGRYRASCAHREAAREWRCARFRTSERGCLDVEDTERQPHASRGRFGVSRSSQVALSFAGEQRPYVEEVARMLQTRGVSVF